MTRRGFLRLGGLAAASIGLVACGQAAAPAAPAKPAESKPAETKPAAPVAPTSAPAASKPAEAAKPAAQQAPATAAKGTVKVWHVWGGDRQPIFEKVLGDFHGKYPDIKVEHTVLSQQGMYEKYLTAIAGGDPPDVMMVHSREVPNFASKRGLMAVDDLVARDKLDLKGTFYAADLEPQYNDGKLYALPQAVAAGNYLIFWNKAHFREAGLDPEKGPKTWTEFAEASRKLTKKSGDSFDRIGSLYWYLGNNAWYQWAANNGGQVFSDDARKVQWDSKENLEALEWLVRNLDEEYGGYERIRSFATQPGPGGAEGNQSWFNGKISMHIIGIWHFLQLQAEAPQLEYGVGLFPFNDKNPAAKVVQFADGGWGYNIPRGAKNVDAAWEWIKYMTLGQGQLDFFKAQGRPSVVPKYNEDPEYTKANPSWPVVQEMLKSAVASPVTPVYAQVRKLSDQMVEEALVKKRTPADAVKWGTEEAQKLHDEYFKSIGG